jgi:hypothetical protein
MIGWDQSRRNAVRSLIQRFQLEITTFEAAPATSQYSQRSAALIFGKQFGRETIAGARFSFTVP